MPYVLTSVSFPAIRAAIDVSIDSVMLPDSIISLDIYQGRAESELGQLDPDYAERDGDDEIRVKRALVYLTAALLCKVVPQITRETIATLSTQRAQVDWNERASELRAMANDEVALYVSEDARTVNIPTLFTTAPGYRGR